ncbi:MAG: YraN family protein [Nitriliruptoraceae bacterium]
MQPTTHHESLELDAATIACASPADIGRLGERLARMHLTENDRATIVARNWRVATGELRGELDCVCLDHESRQLVVVEVKCRVGATRFGGAAAAYPARKHAKVRRLAALYRATHPAMYNSLRIDVVAIDVASSTGRVDLTHFVEVS